MRRPENDLLLLCVPCTENKYTNLPDVNLHPAVPPFFLFAGLHLHVAFFHLTPETLYTLYTVVFLKSADREAVQHVEIKKN